LGFLLFAATEPTAEPSLLAGLLGSISFSCRIGVSESQQLGLKIHTIFLRCLLESFICLAIILCLLHSCCPRSEIIVIVIVHECLLLWLFLRSHLVLRLERAHVHGTTQRLIG
jgi:hypothetical protein